MAGTGRPRGEIRMAQAGSVRGKVVAITGGARGIGYATAERLHADGAKVANGDVDDQRLKTAVGEVRMLPRRSGHVINVSSLAGESYVPGGATYCATKHAVKAYTETARREYRGSGVAISQVMPFFTNTELVAGTSGTKGMRNAEPAE